LGNVITWPQFEKGKNRKIVKKIYEERKHKERQTLPSSCISGYALLSFSFHLQQERPGPSTQEQALKEETGRKRERDKRNCRCGRLGRKTQNILREGGHRRDPSI